MSNLLRPSSVQSLRRVFRESFSAHDIAELLISCERHADATETREFMTSRNLMVAGVRYQGEVIGYVERDDLKGDQCGDAMQEFGDDQVIVDTTSLVETLIRLDRYPRLFVSVFGGIGGIITRTDMQKPPMRMWLFGMITLIEMQMTRRIEDQLPDERWHEFLSQGRLRKAEDLVAERARRNQMVQAIDCLQFSDKCQIIARCEPLRIATRFESRRQVEETAKRIERLRNNLAHAQDIVSTDWHAMVELATYVDDLVADPESD